MAKISLIPLSIVTSFLVVAGCISPPSTPLFFDDFNDGRADGWVVDYGNWSVVRGTYQQNDSSLGSDPDHPLLGYMISRIKGSDYSDFEATVEAQVLSSPKREREVGIIFRGADFRNFYRFRWYTGETPGDDHLQILMYIDNEAVLLEQASIDPMPSGAWFVFKLSAKGDQIKAKVWRKGTPEPYGWDLTATDSEYASGFFGLETYHVKVRFENVSIVHPATNTLELPNL